MKVIITLFSKKMAGGGGGHSLEQGVYYSIDTVKAQIPFILHGENYM